VKQQQEKPWSNWRVARLVLLVLTSVVAIGFVILFALFLLLKASVTAPPPQVKSDATELRDIVNLDIPISSVKWEVFRSPDDSFFPAPDVSTELIAEIVLADPSWFKPDGPIRSNWSLQAEFALPWLSDTFKRFMERATKKDDVIANAPNCGEFKSSIKQSGRPVEGFICAAEGKILLHLTLNPAT
jgi:hypothetical protein